MLLLNSFKDQLGVITKVTVYPSDFGLKMLENESAQGPKNIWRETQAEQIAAAAAAAAAADKADEKTEKSKEGKKGYKFDKKDNKKEKKPKSLFESKKGIIIFFLLHIEQGFNKYSKKYS